MTRDDIIRMAREQGLPETATEGVFIVNADDLGRMLRRYALCDNQPVQRFVGRRNAQERETAMQDALMKFDPATGEERPYPSHATQWRNWHGIAAWLFDPWTGRRRNAYDVGSDVHGLLIAPAGTLGRDMGGSCAEKNNVAGAQPAPSVPDGWKLVPIEPTEDMLRAMTDPFIAINGDNRKAFEIAYTAMLSAAPEAKP